MDRSAQAGGYDAGQGKTKADTRHKIVLLEETLKDTLCILRLDALTRVRYRQPQHALALIYRQIHGDLPLRGELEGIVEKALGHPYRGLHREVDDALGRGRLAELQGNPPGRFTRRAAHLGDQVLQGNVLCLQR